MRTRLVALWISALLVFPLRALADGWFSSDELEYWGKVDGATKAQGRSPRASKPARPRDEGEFQWADYEDPSTDAFWDDGGDYVPPRPLRVAAANPTPDNVARYLRWLGRKAEVVAALQTEIERQKGPPRNTTAPVTERAVDKREQEALIARSGGPRWEEVSLLFFYRSDCPHCQASAPTVKDLEGLGATVIPVQVDWGQRPPLFSTSVPYTEEIAKEQPVDGVPTWIAVYRGDRITMQGEVTKLSIEAALQMAQERKREGTSR